MPYVAGRFGFTESVSITTNFHDVASGYLGMDTSRRIGYYCPATRTTGQFTTQWDGTSTSPSNHVEIPSNMAAITTIGWDSTRDEIFIAEEGQGGGTQKWVRAAASTGAVLNNSTYTYPDTDGNQIQGRGRFFYDPALVVWWGVATGTTNGFIYLAKLVPSGAGFVATVQGLGVALTTSPVNRSTLIDNAGTVWFVTSGYVVKCHPSLPATFAHGTIVDQEAAFIWRARNEIWIPRASGHGTSGYRVFNIGTEAFANSVDLGLGTWTVVGAQGIENFASRAWIFEKAGGNQMNGSLRNTTGTQTRSFTNLWTEPATIESLQYVTGKVFVDNNKYRAVLE
jgi:hypothetical protein